MTIILFTDRIHSEGFKVQIKMKDLREKKEKKVSLTQKNKLGERKKGKKKEKKVKRGNVGLLTHGSTIKNV